MDGRGGGRSGGAVGLPDRVETNVLRGEPMNIDVYKRQVYHNGASVYVIFHARTNGCDKDGEQRYLECLRVAIETSLKFGGNVSHHHGVGTAKSEFLPQELGEAGIKVLKAIKLGIDPNHILNKGVLGL